MRTRSSVGIALLGIISVSTACVAQSEDDEAEILAEVEVPEGFRFKTIKPVDVHYVAPAELIGPGAMAELSLPSGAVLSRGPIIVGRPYKAQVSVPAGTHALRLEFRGSTVELPIVDGVAGN